jgi:PKD repeat protein
MKVASRAWAALATAPALVWLLGLSTIDAAESPYLYGIHDFDPSPQPFLDRISAGGATGWVTATVAIGSDPGNPNGDDFSAVANQGHTVIVRLNHGYCPDGSIPPPSKYSDFARRAANYVAASQGAHIWIVGNETNLPGEWPAVAGHATAVSPQNYAALFRQVYDAIKNVRPNDKVIPQALAPFAGPLGSGTVQCGGAVYTHDRQPLNWVQYMNQMLTSIKETGPLDGIAVHINSRGYSREDIHSTQTVNAGGQELYFSFYVYKDWVNLGIPNDLYHLPIYATEANGYYYWSGGHPENGAARYQAGWVQEIYAEIDRYNQQAAATGKPVFRCIALYRWCGWCDGWNIDGSPYEGQILTDLDQAVAAKYRSPGSSPPPATPPGENVAQGAVGWTASSSYSSDFGGNKAYDGVVSAASKWTSSGSTADSWLALDLGGSYGLTGFIVRHAGAAGELAAFNTQAYQLESGESLSGPWTTLAAVNNPNQENVTATLLPSPLAARFVRLFVTDAGVDDYARIPELEVYATPAPPPPAGAFANGGFEGSVQVNGVGESWTAFGSTGYGATYAVVADVVHGGARAQKIVSPQPSSSDKYAGVYQTVPTEPAVGYVIRAWSRTRFSGGSAWDHIARLGIDLSGGTNFQEGSVTWHEFDSAKDAWHLLERRVTATGSSMTLFLQSWRKWASGGGSDSWFDDVEVAPEAVNRPPVAVASANPTSGTAPLTVTFDGAGSGDPDGDALSYDWSFGDGAQGSGATASHVYGAGGTFTATLTVTDGRGGSASASATIRVNSRPTAVVAANPTAGPAPLTVSFNSAGSSDPDGDALTYAWNFGDGAQGSGATASHVYASPGVFTATLAVNDGRGGTDDASAVVTVRASTPPGGNVARDAAGWAASSSYSGSFGGDKAYDGVVSVASKWTSDGSTVDSWLALDLGTQYELSGFIVRHAGAAGELSGFNTQAYRFESGGSLSGPWTTLATVSNAAQENVMTTLLASLATTRFVRLYVTDAGVDNYARIPELEVYGSPPPATDLIRNGSFDSGLDGWSVWIERGTLAPTAASGQLHLQSPNHNGGVYQQFATGGAGATIKVSGFWASDPTVANFQWAEVLLINSSRLPANGEDVHTGQSDVVLIYKNDTWASPGGWSGAMSQTAPVANQGAFVAQGSVATLVLKSGNLGGATTGTRFDSVVVRAASSPPGNHPPTAVVSGSPTTGTAPLSVSFSGAASSDPDGDSLNFTWSFGDGTEGSGATVTHTYQGAGTFTASLTVNDGRGGTDTATVVVSVTGVRPPLPDYCPQVPVPDFEAIRAQLNQQGEDLGFVKIGFHAAPTGNHTGLGNWERCLDAAGVPFFLKSVDSAGHILEAARIKAASGVPHVLVYRKAGIGPGGFWYDLPDYSLTPYDAAVLHWERHLAVFPDELEPYKNLIWLETINEVDKNRSEWLAEFSYHTAQMALAAGFNWAAFAWSSGEPEPEHWIGPSYPPTPDNPEGKSWMQRFLERAGSHPDRIAIALHEYAYTTTRLSESYPYLLGRFETLFEICDSLGIRRPRVLMTEFGWPGDIPSDAMAIDFPWAAELYASYPEVLGAALWYLGSGGPPTTQQYIAPMTKYALQTYFVIPLPSGSPSPTGLR